MRCFLFSILMLSSPGAIPWYSEFGNEISGVGAYDTTGHQYILIAFNRSENCNSASLWLDGSLRDESFSDKSQNTKAILKVDNYSDWNLLFDYIETDNWLTGFWVLKQEVPLGIVRQLRKGNLLTISIGVNKHSWSLVGSNAAMKSAYNAC